jgi:hypothetical protein
MRCSREITAVFLEKTAVFSGHHRGVLRANRGVEFHDSGVPG